jgi:hypothetical protein
MKLFSVDDATVIATFDLDQRVLFRAGLDLAKRRLIIALLFVAMLIAGLIYLFLLIGEQNILWQTSPLFIGLPLVAWGGQILRLYATTRKYVLSLAPSKRTIQYMFLSNTDGYEIISGESSAHIAWADMLKVTERRSYFLLHLNRFEVNVIPKSAFEPAGLPIFRAILKSKLGQRAELKV